MTTMTHLAHGPDAPPEAAHPADGRLEVVLDEMVRTDPGPPLPPDFTVRVLAARPFAPWEVRHPRAWRLPAVAGGTLLVSSLGLTFTPLLTLGPETAVTVWSDLLALLLARPAGSVVSAAPLLARAARSVAGSMTPGAFLALGGLAGSLVLALVALLGRRPAAAAVRDARNG